MGEQPNTRTSSNGSANTQYYDVYGTNYIVAKHLQSLTLDNCINSHPGDGSEYIDTSTLYNRSIMVYDACDVNMNKTTIYNLGPVSGNMEAPAFIFC